MYRKHILQLISVQYKITFYIWAAFELRATRKKIIDIKFYC